MKLVIAVGKNFYKSTQGKITFKQAEEDNENRRDLR